MEECIDKLLLISLGCILAFTKANVEELVVSLLLAVLFTSFGFYIEGKKWILLLMTAAFFAAVFQPLMLCFFPALLYDMIQKKIYAAAAPFFIFGIWHLPDTPQKTALFLITLALSGILAEKTQKKRLLREELIQTWDNGTERNLLLMEKNKNLIEKQDYEIYLAVLKERTRIAREIHDNVGHMLSRLLLMTGALLTREKEGALHDQLCQMKDTLDLAMNSIRQSVHNLHNDSIDLKRAIEEMTEPISREFEVKFIYDMTDDIPRQVKYCLAAVAKEAVSNILKHSDGDFVQIRLREHPEFYQLMIQDNGGNAKVLPEKGIGLQNMKERAEALGGTFRVHIQPGFSVFLSIPKKEEALCG